jgi:hypothetical protein
LELPEIVQETIGTGRFSSFEPPFSVAIFDKPWPWFSSRHQDEDVGTYAPPKSGRTEEKYPGRSGIGFMGHDRVEAC